MFAEPTISERLLLLISTKHPTFTTTWLPIYNAQDNMKAPVMLEKTKFFQIEAEVVKNSKRDDYVNGLLNKDEMVYQLTYEGGAGVYLHFPNCLRRFDMELKFAVVLNEPEDFQVWGTRKLGREFHQKLVGLHNDKNREAFYSRYLLELYGHTGHGTDLVSISEL
jgi:hypothetical protein